MKIIVLSWCYDEMDRHSICEVLGAPDGFDFQVMVDRLAVEAPYYFKKLVWQPSEKYTQLILDPDYTEQLCGWLLEQPGIVRLAWEEHNLAEVYFPKRSWK